MDFKKLQQNSRNRQMVQRLNARGMGSVAAPGQVPSGPAMPYGPRDRSTVNDAASSRAGQRSNQNGGWQNSAPTSGGNGSAQAMSQKFTHGILAGFSPGNIGDINQVVWPFWFTFSFHDLAPGQSITEQFTVTQEAAYLVRQITQATYLKNPISGAYTYIDPFYFDESANSANGLTFTLEDSSSSRYFNGRTPENVSQLGNSNFPVVYPSTVFMLPNQTWLLNLMNTNATDTYNCQVTVMGYRARLNDAQKILSTVSG